MTHIFRNTTIKCAVICAAGLLASCTSTPIHNAPLAANTLPSAETTVAIETVQPHPDSESPKTSQQTHTTQARIERLQRDQLQAFSNKCTYSANKTALATPQQTAAPEQKPQPKKKPTEYIVQRGENLYAIAAHSNIYQEGLLWPLIYKANRDQIKDPQQIFPGQALTIPRQNSDDEKENARETARNSGIFIQAHDDQQTSPLSIR